jgi:hypothetical protein
VTRADLSRLGLDHLLGSPLLRAYMHGFFIDARLYSKAAAAAAPGGYEAWRAAKVAAKLDEERRSRISVARKLPKVCRGEVRGAGVGGGRVRLTALRTDWLGTHRCVRHNRMLS